MEILDDNEKPVCLTQPHPEKILAFPHHMTTVVAHDKAGRLLLYTSDNNLIMPTAAGPRFINQSLDEAAEFHLVQATGHSGKLRERGRIKTHKAINTIFYASFSIAMLNALATPKFTIVNPEDCKFFIQKNLLSPILLQALEFF